MDPNTRPEQRRREEEGLGQGKHTEDADIFTFLQGVYTTCFSQLITVKYA